MLYRGEMKPQKHHYIPEFYLRAWCSPSGTLTEFCRRQVGRKETRVVPRDTAPGGTAYKYDLYSLPGDDPAFLNIIEEKVMGATDRHAAEAHVRLLSGIDEEWDGKQRSSWSRFIMSLIHRNPEKVEWLHKTAEGWLTKIAQSELEWGPRVSTLRKTDPTFVRKLALQTLEEIMDLKVVGDQINGMHWAATTIPDRSGSFLTSDRPVVMSDGIKYPDSLILLPISPRTIFSAANSESVPDRLAKMPPSLLVTQVNDVVASQAAKFVYGQDDSQLRFVENRLGRLPPQFIGVKDPQ